MITLYHEDAFGFHLGLSGTVSCPSSVLGILLNKIHLNQNIPPEEKPKKVSQKIIRETPKTLQKILLVLRDFHWKI